MTHDEKKEKLKRDAEYRMNSILSQARCRIVPVHLGIHGGLLALFGLPGRWILAFCCENPSGRDMCCCCTHHHR